MSERIVEPVPGTLFSPTLPEGHEPATLLFRGQTAVVEGRTQTRQWNTRDLRIERGGAARRMLFLSSPGAVEERFATSELALVAHPAFAAHPQASRLQKERQRGSLLLVAAVLVVVLVALGAIAGVVWGAVRGVDPLVVAVANRIPHTLEKKLGDAVMTAMGNDLVLLEKPAAEFRELAKPLFDVVSYPIPFSLHVASEKTVNAFALPGAHVVFFSGLLMEARSPHEALGVLAHEMAHVTERHTLRQLVRTTGLVLSFQLLLGDVGGLSGAAAGLAERLLTFSYSRDLEREADARAVEYLIEAGVDPQGIVTFFERMESKRKDPDAKKENGSKKKGSEDWGNVDRERLASLGELMSTHPSLASRREAIREKSRGFEPQKHISGFDWAGFQKRLTEASRL